jgi:hypothetical protein
MRFRPDLVSAIMQVPQRYAGSYPVGKSESDSRAQITVRFDDQTLEEMKRFRQQLKQPLRSAIIYDDLIESMDTVEMIKSQASR